MYKFFIMVLVPALLCAELLLVEKADIEYSQELYKKFSIVTFINNSTALVLGEPTEIAAGFTLQILEKEWDGNSSYFLLFKRAQKHNREAIEKQGTILYDNPYYTIFKTSHKTLNSYDGFSIYDIVGISLNETNRTFPEIEVSSRNSYELDPIIDSIVQSVAVDSIWNNIDTLQELERYTYASGVSLSVTYFEEYLQSLAFDTVIIDNYLGNGAPNIIVEKLGKKNPDEIVIVCCHYDVSKQGYPGADDNGSGSAGTLEIARIISELTFNKTLKLMWFSGEEISLLGSKDYAQKAFNAGENIIGVFNLDMIGYLKQGDPLQLDVGYNASSKTLFEQFTTIAELYSPETPIMDCKNSQWVNSSDHKSFWDKRYPGLYFGDDLDPYGPTHPNYHQLSDTLGTGVNSKPYLEGVVKSVTAAIVVMAERWQDTNIKSSQKAIQNQHSLTLLKNRQLLLSTSEIPADESNVSIVTPSGRIMLEHPLKSELYLDLSTLSSGAYLLIIQNGDAIYEERIRL